MNKQKMASGILTILVAGIAVGLILSSKRGRQTGRNLIQTGNRLTEDLKGKFNEFVDQLNEKVQGILK